jgi:hypothetical protein
VRDLALPAPGTPGFIWELTGLPPGLRLCRLVGVANENLERLSRPERIAALRANQLIIDFARLAQVMLAAEILRHRRRQAARRLAALVAGLGPAAAGAGGDLERDAQLGGGPHLGLDQGLQCG